MKQNNKTSDIIFNDNNKPFNGDAMLQVERWILKQQFKKRFIEMYPMEEDVAESFAEQLMGDIV